MIRLVDWYCDIDLFVFANLSQPRVLFIEVLKIYSEI